MRRILGVFAKLPEPGRVKTRLAAATSPEFAAHVADAFLRDSLRRLAPIAAHHVPAFAPAEAASPFVFLVDDRVDLEPQAEGDLGQRMNAFFAARFDTPDTAVVLLGTDSPTLPPEFVEQAFTKLESADVVFGPATDGGYYLIGCRRLPPIFDGIAWSGPRVLAESIARLSDPAWKVALLPPWYDVDTIDDWRMLCGHLAAMERCGIDPNLPHTQVLIRSFPCT